MEKYRKEVLYMAKKSSGISLGKIVGFMAFCALLIAGVAAIVGLFSGSLGIVAVIGHIMLVGSVFIAGWGFICSTNLPGKKLYWQIALIVFAILAAVGAVNLMN